MAGRQLQINAPAARQPQHLPISPVTLGRNFCRAQLAMMLEHGGEEYRFVADAVAQPGQDLGQ